MADKEFPFTDGQTYTNVPADKQPIPPKDAPVAPGTSIPDNAFDNPLEGPTWTGGAPAPQPKT